jgi:prephenate dehydrogenase
MNIGVLGLGKFGGAFVNLVRQYGHNALGFDVGKPHDVASAEELVERSEIVVLAVPVGVMREAIEQIRPFLRTDQLVIDVGSVKVEPEKHLNELLEDKIAWAATHPLFGPVSLSRNEPRTVIVCPRDQSRDATSRARSLFEQLDCSVIEVTAEEHDRVMAKTHVLAFFVAKALQEIGAASAPFAPPSFQSMARVVELVREDAGHLFNAIQTGNPYASEARQALINALKRINAEIETATLT